MLRPRVGWLARGMQWKTQERKSADASQRRNGLRLRRHATAERFAPGNKGQPRAASRRFLHRRPHRGMSDRRRIRSPAGFFHIRELIAQRRDTAVAKPARNQLHKWMGHPRAGAMGKDKARARRQRPEQERGDIVRAIDFEFQLLRADDAHLALAGWEALKMAIIYPP